LPEESKIFIELEKKLINLFNLFGYTPIYTPIIEHAELFIRSVGEETDIVSKEMYIFKDKGGRENALRPEGTAGVVRAYIEHGYSTSNPVQRFYYIGPMFRYERKQKGRYRQFYQFGFELFGFSSPQADFEILNLCEKIYKVAGIPEDEFELKINNIGCKVCRPVYKKELYNFLIKRKSMLCENCKLRLDRNILRVLDCKNPQCKEALHNHPETLDYLCEDCANHHKTLKELLDSARIKYIEDRNIVRGLDYYTKTAFEIQHQGLGSQNALGGGGRYDNLVKELGGPDIPAVGYAGGIDRLLLLKEHKPESFDIIFITIDNTYKLSLNILNQLRENGISVVEDHTDKSLGKKLKAAAKLNVKYAIIIGENEAKNNTVLIKNLEERTQIELNQSEVGEYLKTK